MPDAVELLFFDTFAHDNTEELNLDLVQFPKPVYVTEVRIIPLGARVQADFPGGVRLGATNPSQFQIEFFVNDLGKPGASTFETLGGFEYNQNGCINLECVPEETIRKIPTDGLVLRGWYTTITLAVYGILTNNLAEEIIQPAVNPSLPQQPKSIDVQQVVSTGNIESEWAPQETIQIAQQEYTAYQPVPYAQAEPYTQEYNAHAHVHQEYYNELELPKDPRNYHHLSEEEWDKSRVKPLNYERDREHTKESYKSTEKHHSRQESDRKDRDKRYSRSLSRERDRSKDYREISRDRERESDFRDRDRDRYRERERDRDRSYKHDDNYRRSYNREERDDRKRPRTPPMKSPKRPHTPIIETAASNTNNTNIEPVVEEKEASLAAAVEHGIDAEKQECNIEIESKESTSTCTGAGTSTSATEVIKKDPAPVEESNQMDVEEFEPILSDEDILDDVDHYQDADYDYSAYSNNDDLIKLFAPGVTELLKPERVSLFQFKSDKLEVEESLKTVIGIVDDYFKASITKYSLSGFDSLNTEIKEEFIHLAERLVNAFSCVNNFYTVMKLHKAISSGNFSPSESDLEIVSQVQDIIECMIDWIEIALSYEMANAQTQPAYKIRHIKCGLRLAEWCCSSYEFVSLLWSKNINIHSILLNLYKQEYMALSIKLMILKALDVYLLNKGAIEKLVSINDKLKENGFENKLISNDNGYHILINYMIANPPVRLKFALNSVLRKVNLFEVCYKMQNIFKKMMLSNSDVTAEEINLVAKSLDHMLQVCLNGNFVLSQPKRFLPVSSQFEILRDDTRNILVEFLKMFDLLPCFNILLMHPSTINLPPIKTPIFEIITQLMKSCEGLEYLSDNYDSINLLLKFLLKVEDVQYSVHDFEIKSFNFGLKVAYKLQSLHHIEWLLNNAKKYGYDCDCNQINEHLHRLFCLTFSSIGKVAVAEVLGLRNNLKSLLQFFTAIHSKELSDAMVFKVSKSPGFGYIVDLLQIAVITVPNIDMMESYFKEIMQIVYYQDAFEGSLLSKLNEIRNYMLPLIPFENDFPIKYDKIPEFVEIIKKPNDNINSIFSGQIITSLRIIHYLGIPHESLSIPVPADNPFNNYIELKHKFVILQLFSLDGVYILMDILQKISNCYEQPNLHTPIFVSHQGTIIMNIIHPCVELLKQILTYVIHCRGLNFKDLTVIPVLLNTFNLLHSYPSNSQSYFQAQNVANLIVDTLLLYTQPVSEEIHEKDSLNKTLWSLMCGEVIKNIMSAPYRVIPGLLIFSELLPLPLPIQTGDTLSREEINWASNLRKLWSAHLHPHSNAIQEIVTKLCTTSQQQLLNLLRRVCVQLADLASNSALMVIKGILDLLYELLVSKEETKSGPCNSNIARLLNFLCLLMEHGTLKCALLHLLTNNSTGTGTGTSSTLKTDYKYQNLIPALMQILKFENNTNSHTQAQECILSIVQSFSDSEITVLQNPITGPITSDIYLANALPGKDNLVVFISTIFEHVPVESSFVTYLPIVRTLLLLTEHDYGFYHLRELLLKKNDYFLTLLNRLASGFIKDNAEYLSTLSTVIEFLRVSITTDVVEEQLLYTPRTMKLSLEELKSLISWNSECNNENESEKHSLLKLQEILKQTVEEDSSFEELLESITNLIKLLSSNEPVSSIKQESYTEPLLPPPESLLNQFANRIIYSSSDACDERLTTVFWLSSPTEEIEGETETIISDLSEIIRHDLPSDYNLTKEIEKLCRINPSEDVDSKDNHSANKTKMKKPFVTPMRGRSFSRNMPQRPDLFRSRPPNTSRPPSLHVDDFVALETCGAQPTGPTGYNKISRELLATSRIARGCRGRTFVTSERAARYRQLSWWGAGRLY